MIYELEKKGVLKKMKIIDFEKNENVIRLYLGQNHCTDYWGDDFDDAPYEHNAGTVYSNFVCGIAEFAFPLDLLVCEPADDWHYRGNSPFCKQDFIQRKAPCLIIGKNIKYPYECYSAFMNDLSRIYDEDDEPKPEHMEIFFEDDYDAVKAKIIQFHNYIL